MNNFSILKTAVLATIFITASLALTGCSQSGSIAAPQAAIDTAPPAIPTGFSAMTRPSTVKLSWRPNTTDADFQGFMVYRLAFGQTWPLLDTPTQATAFLDRNPLRGPATYAITAIDLAGNESALVEIDVNLPPWEGIAVTR